MSLRSTIPLATTCNKGPQSTIAGVPENYPITNTQPHIVPIEFPKKCRVCKKTFQNADIFYFDQEKHDTEKSLGEKPMDQTFTSSVALCGQSSAVSYTLSKKIFA
jgi:hypothetical protein